VNWLDLRPPQTGTLCRIPTDRSQILHVKDVKLQLPSVSPAVSCTASVASSGKVLHAIAGLHGRTGQLQNDVARALTVPRSRAAMQERGRPGIRGCQLARQRGHNALDANVHVAIGRKR